jgi:hypothetical protein
MGPSEDPPTDRQNQTSSKGKTAGAKRARRPRSRVCLLKGCHQVFRPQHPLTCYCSEECREEARRWSQGKARRRYRQSESGKQKRQAQSRRRRRRCQDRQKNAGRNERVGHHPKLFFRARATVPAAMESSSGAAGHRYRGIVPTRVAVLWNGFWSEKDAGANGSPPGAETPLQSSRHIAPFRAVSIFSAYPPGER